MASKQWGDPVITLRIPKWQIAGLKMIARKTGHTVSFLIRDQIEAVLSLYDITEQSISTEPIPGQISTSDLVDE